MEPATSEFAGTDRYEVVRPLGAGAFGRVWEVRDRKHGRSLALKELTRVAPQDVQRFRAEFRAIAEFVHPNVVALYELENAGGTWFFTMELVRGRHLLSHLGVARTTARSDTWSFTRSGDTLADEGVAEALALAARVSGPAGASGAAEARPRADANTVRAVFRQLAEGVAAIHDAGMLHRDIKPANVVVSEGGRAVLLDFGLVQAAEAGVSAVAGTPGYMAPEQAVQGALGPAADWYAFGASLFEALAGRLPFEGAPSEVLRLQRLEVAPDLRDLGLLSDVPEDLAHLVAGLLKRDPAERPDASVVLGTLGGKRGIAWRRAAFVGRTPELASLTAAWAAVAPGRPMVVGVSGTGGVGKSALVRQFVANLSVAAGGLGSAPRVLAARCWERESIPYKALSDVVQQLSFPDDDARTDLARLFPALARVEPAPDADARELRRRASLALRRALAHLASAGPVIVTIDDVQWGDADSAEMIETALAPPGAPGVLLVFTVREEGRDAALPAALLRLGRSGLNVVDLRLSPLSSDVVREMVVRLVGEGPQADRIVAEAGGLPYDVESLAQEGVAGATGSRGFSWLAVEDLVLLRAVVLAGQPVPRELVRAVTGLADDTAALARLRLRRLVRATGTPGDETLEPQHDRLREAIAATTADRPAVHRAWSAVLAARDADPEWRLLHHREAGERELAAQCAERAADRAMEALAFHHAAELYAEALALGGPATLHRRRAEALVGCGRAPEAADAWLVAAKDATPSDALELRRRAAEQLWLAGHAERGKVVAEQVLRPLGMQIATWSVVAVVSMLWTRFWLARDGYRFTPRSKPDEKLLFRLDTCWSLASAMSLVDTPRASDFQARQSKLALAAGDPLRAARALGLEAGYIAIGGPSQQAQTDALIAKARALAEPLSDPYVHAFLDLSEAIVHYLGGRYGRAIDTFAAVEPALRKCRNTNWEQSAAICMTMDSRMRSGRWTDVAATLPAIAAEARHTGNRYVYGFTEFVRCTTLLLADDRPDDAIAAIKECYPRPNGSQPTVQDWWGLHGAAPAHMYKGDFDYALRKLDQHGAALMIAGLPLVAVLATTMHHTRGAAAIGASRRAKGWRKSWLQLRTAWYAERLRRLNVPWGEPFGALLEGCRSLGEGDLHSAIVNFQESHAGLVATEHGVFADCVLLRLGTVLGGDYGKALVALGGMGLRRQGVKRPDRLADALVPDPR